MGPVVSGRVIAVTVVTADVGLSLVWVGLRWAELGRANQWSNTECVCMSDFRFELELGVWVRRVDIMVD